LPLQKATQQVLEQAEPMAKDITQGLITPGAKALAENAVPITEEACSQLLPQESPVIVNSKVLL